MLFFLASKVHSNHHCPSTHHYTRYASKTDRPDSLVHGVLHSWLTTLPYSFEHSFFLRRNYQIKNRHLDSSRVQRIPRYNTTVQFKWMHYQWISIRKIIVSKMMFYLLFILINDLKFTLATKQRTGSAIDFIFIRFGGPMSVLLRPMAIAIRYVLFNRKRILKTWLV